MPEISGGFGWWRGFRHTVFLVRHIAGAQASVLDLKQSYIESLFSWKSKAFSYHGRSSFPAIVNHAVFGEKIDKLAGEIVGRS